MQSIKCKLAEFGLSITNSGALAPCCQYIYTQKMNKYSYKELRPFEVNNRQKILEELDNGIQHNGCDLCWRAENNGKTSLRQWANEQYRDVDISNRGVTKVGNPEIVDLDLTIGNLCNLKCVMCGPYASTQWVSEITKHRIKFQFNAFDTLGDPAFHDQWWDDPVLLDFISNRAKDALKINFTGGEPFMLPGLPEILKNVHENNKNKKYTIQFNTNGTYATDEILDRVVKFPNIKLIISLEGIGDHNDYIRFPSKWDKINENIQKFRRYKAHYDLECNPLYADDHDYKTFFISVHHTLQPSSAHALPALAKYCEDNELPLTINFLHHGFFQLSAITENQKQSLLEWAKEKTSQYTDSAKDEVFNIISNVVPNSEETARYKRYVLFLDSIRNNSYEAVFGKFDD